MPTYEYRCPTGHDFEKFQKMNEKGRARCPVCRRVARRKISGGAGLVFKGSGFYITDYRSDNYKQAAKKESSAAKPAAGADSSKPSSAKADAKPAKPASPKT